MKVATKKSIIVAVSLLMFIGFQNCAKVTFKSTLAPNSKLSEGDGLGDGIDIPEVTNEDGDDGGDVVNTPTDGDDQQGAMDYICVLSGSGDSHVLQFSGDLYGDTSKNKTVCTTERGCLEIAAQVFDVDHVKQEGQRCEHASSVIQMNEATLQQEVDKLKN